MLFCGVSRRLATFMEDFAKLRQPVDEREEAALALFLYALHGG